MRRQYKTLAAAAMAMSAHTAVAATIVTSGNSVVGVDDLVVGSYSWTVSFTSGTFASVYGATSATPPGSFDFSTQADALAAATALFQFLTPAEAARVPGADNNSNYYPKSIIPYSIGAPEGYAQKAQKVGPIQYYAAAAKIPIGFAGIGVNGAYFNDNGSANPSHATANFYGDFIRKDVARSRQPTQAEIDSQIAAVTAAFPNQSYYFAVFSDPVSLTSEGAVGIPEPAAMTSLATFALGLFGAWRLRPRRPG